MDSVSTRMKVVTPLGDEEFDMTIKDSILTVHIFKGSADLSVELEEENKIVASGILAVPFDCKLTIEIINDTPVHGTVYLTDPLLNEVFLQAECKEL